MSDMPRPAVTRWLAELSSSLRADDLSEEAITLARQCVLDWFAVTIPGAAEPAVRILREDLLADGARPVASLVADAARTSAMNAALVNGTASHALDFDDVNMAILGHPTVAVLPGLLALAEETGATQREILVAFVAGYDVACRTGALMSPSHYGHGFHATATVGSIGAAAACARLLRLDAEATATAYGIAATMASGLKSMFGTMCKPLHAGRAAQNGLQAARMAARGFTSRPDALECPQGLAATQSMDFNPDEAMKAGSPEAHLRKISSSTTRPAISRTAPSRRRETSARRTASCPVRSNRSRSGRRGSPTAYAISLRRRRVSRRSSRSG